MRKIYLFTTIGLLSAISSFGQVLFGIQGSGQSTNIAVTAPVGGQQIVSDLSAYLKPKYGFRAGLMADIPITDNLSLRPQLLYSAKGTTLDLSSLLGGLGSVDKSVFQAPISYNFIELPIQAMYGLDAGPGRVVLGAGPYVGYLLNANVTFSGDTQDVDLAGAKRLDLGAQASIGYELPMGITASVYYAHGFTNLSSDQGVSSSGGATPSLSINGAGTANTRAFGLTLGFFFGAGN